jgi:hypothetical protein
MCCFEVIIAASVLVIPLLLFLCNCYKKKVARLTNLHSNSYALLANALLEFPNLQTVHIQVEDSHLKLEKTILIEKAAMKLNQLQSFTFYNFEDGIDVEGRNYSSFKTYFKWIQNCGSINYRLRWDNHLLVGIAEKVSNADENSIHVNCVK